MSGDVIAVLRMVTLTLSLTSIGVSAWAMLEVRRNAKRLEDIKARRQAREKRW